MFSLIWPQKLMAMGERVHSPGWLPFKGNKIWIFLCLDHRGKNALVLITTEHIKNLSDSKQHTGGIQQVDAARLQRAKKWESDVGLYTFALPLVC